MSNTTITSPKGFIASGLYCGIKRSGKNDIGLIVCPTGATAAAVFTTNKVFSATVAVSRENIQSKKIYAVVVNSGNANACTGQIGIKNAKMMCKMAAKNFAFDEKCIFVASTGIIGHQLPMEKVTKGISLAAQKVDSTEKSGLDFLNAIMTTDTKMKSSFQQIVVGCKKITIAGITKGAGMISPNMATTLLFVTTDAVISKSLLQKAFSNAIGGSLNRLTVDGHQSTNDTGIILSSGLAQNKPISSQNSEFRKFEQALAVLCDDLARQMALDAEGATRMFKVVIKGAATQADAAKASRAVADYPLFKCAVNGGDPNWGRIICAVGSSGVKLKSEKMSCKLDNLAVFKKGQPTHFNTKEAEKVVSKTSFTITIELGVGKFSNYCYGCDLSREYVSINADYHT